MSFKTVILKNGPLGALYRGRQYQVSMPLKRLTRLQAALARGLTLSRPRTSLHVLTSDHFPLFSASLRSLRPSMLKIQLCVMDLYFSA